MVNNGFIMEGVLAPSASLAPHGGRWSQQQATARTSMDGYPLVYGTNVWVKDAPLISKRVLPDGKIERIHVLSIGQYDGDIGGWLGEIESVIYDSCCRVVDGSIEIRLGKKQQEPITTSFYVPCEATCCTCQATGLQPAFGDVANRVEVSVDVSTEPGVINAWVVVADGVAIGTVWCNAPAKYLFSVAGATTVELQAIPAATGVAPYIQLEDGGPAITVSRISANGRTANYPAPPETPNEGNIQSTAVLNDIDPTCSGLAVVKTITACQSDLVFKVLRGRQGRSLYAGGMIETTIDAALESIINAGGLPIGATLENTNTGIQGVITDGKSIPPLSFRPGQTYSVWKLDTLVALPEIYIDLVRSVGGGINELVSKHSLDYSYLQIANDYCLGNKYLFNGVVRRQPLTYFLQNAAPQAGLIVTRRENRTGLYPADPLQNPTRVYTVGNTNDHCVVWEPFDYHATNRLVINFNNNKKCDYGTVIAQDIELQKQRLAIIEEALKWEYVDNSEQAVDLAVQYFNAIRFDRLVCRFTATTPVYVLEPGDIFEFTTPLWETQGEFSGRALADTTPGRLVPSWEPILHSSAHTVATISGTKLATKHVDFTVLVAPGDVVLTPDTYAIVTTVTPGELTLDRELPSSVNYKILDLTLDDTYTLSWDTWNTSKDKGYNKLAALPEWDANTNRVVYTGINVAPGDAVVLSKTHWLWRCAAVEPTAQGAFRVIGTVFYPGHNELIRTHLIT